MVLLAGDVSFPALFVKKADETAVTPFCVYGLSLFPVAVYSAVLTFVTSDCHSAWSVYQLPYSLEKTCAFAAAETSESRAVLATMPTSRLEIRDIWSLSFGAFEGIRTHQMQVGIWWMSAGHGAMAELHTGDAQAREKARYAIEHFFLRNNR